jgi:hypothetical protein
VSYCLLLRLANALRLRRCGGRLLRATQLSGAISELVSAILARDKLTQLHRLHMGRDSIAIAPENVCRTLRNNAHLKRFVVHERFDKHDVNCVRACAVAPVERVAPSLLCEFNLRQRRSALRVEHLGGAALVARNVRHDTLSRELCVSRTAPFARVVLVSSLRERHALRVS